ncbi:uncharacterized protein AB675_3938 [Cyphellophora attinorum]|uniref:Uncharacterized protein n=1 Tax=Cyphellophora attinorum TaxID=1664694 RepID=A0A0N1HL02_9EURO|nr:uncharacterized protein AB675_3938 [Phialophora attinorum]KPI37556.1 hypothetical protein AB675_3938 [Phialophora attinorum]
MAPRRAPLEDLSRLFANTTSAPRGHSYLDLDKPLDTKSAYNSNTGVKRLGAKRHAYAGFGEYRNNPRLSQAAYSLEDKDNKAWAAALDEIENRNIRKPPSPEVKPASKDNRQAVAATVTPVKAIPNAPAPTSPPTALPKKIFASQTVADTVKAVSSGTATLSTTLSSQKTGFSSFTAADTVNNGAKRKWIEPESTEAIEARKKRSLQPVPTGITEQQNRRSVRPGPVGVTGAQKRQSGHTGCKRSIKQEDDSVRDTVMCDCDDPLHSVSDE